MFDIIKAKLTDYLSEHSMSTSRESVFTEGADWKMEKPGTLISPHELTLNTHDLDMSKCRNVEKWLNMADIS